MEGALFSALSHDGIFAALLRWLAAAQLVDTCGTSAEDGVDPETSAFVEALSTLSPAELATHFCARINYEAAQALEAAEVALRADNNAECSRSGASEAARGDAGLRQAGQQQQSSGVTQLSRAQEGCSATQRSPGLLDNDNFPAWSRPARLRRPQR